MRKTLLIISILFALSVVNAGSQTAVIDTDSLINEIEVYSDTASVDGVYWDVDEMLPDDEQFDDLQEWESAYSSGIGSIIEGILTIISVVGIVAVIIVIILLILPIVMIVLIIWLWSENRRLKQRLRILEMSKRNHMP